MPREILPEFSKVLNDLTRPDLLDKNALQLSTNLEFRDDGYIKKRMGVDDYDADLNTRLSGQFDTSILRISPPFYPKTKPTGMDGDFILLVYGVDSGSYKLIAVYYDTAATNNWAVDALAGLSDIAYTSDSDLLFTIGGDRVIITDGINPAHYVSVDDDGNIISGVLGIPSPKNKASIEAMDGFDASQYETNANQDYVSIPGLFQCVYTVITEDGEESNPSPISLTHDMQWFKVDTDGSHEQWINQIYINNLSVPDVSDDVLAKLKYFKVYIRVIPYSEGDTPYSLEYSQQFEIVDKTRTWGTTGNNYLVSVAATPGDSADYENDVSPIAKYSAYLNEVVALGNVKTKFGFPYDYDHYVPITVNNINSRTYVDGIVRIRLYDEGSGNTDAITDLDWSDFDADSDGYLDLSSLHLLRIFDNDRITPLPVVAEVTATSGYCDIWVSIPQLPASTPYTIYFAWTNPADATDDSGFLGVEWDASDPSYWGITLESKSIVSLAVSDHGIVVALAENGYIYRSSNFGKTYVVVNTTTGSRTMEDIAWVGAGTFIAVGDDATDGICYISTDYGKTWAAEAAIDTGVLATAHSVSGTAGSALVIGELTATGQVAIYKYSFGGGWSQEQDLGAGTTSGGVILYCPDGWYAGADDYIYYWDGAGATNFSQGVNFSGNDLTAIFYITTDTLLVGTDAGSIHLTTNGATSFSVKYAGANKIWAFDRDTNGDIYAVEGDGSTTGQLVISDDTGLTWTASDVDNYPFVDIVCVGIYYDNIALACGTVGGHVFSLLRSEFVFDNGQWFVLDVSPWEDQKLLNSKRVLDTNDLVCLPFNDLEDYSGVAINALSPSYNKANINSNPYFTQNSGTAWLGGGAISYPPMFGSSNKVGVASARNSSTGDNYFGAAAGGDWPGTDVPESGYISTFMQVKSLAVGATTQNNLFQIVGNGTLYQICLKDAGGGTYYWNLYDTNTATDYFGTDISFSNTGVNVFVVFSWNDTNISLHVVNLATGAIYSSDATLTLDIDSPFHVTFGSASATNTCPDETYYDQCSVGTNRYFNPDADEDTVLNMANFMPAMDTVLGYHYGTDTHNHYIVFGDTEAPSYKAKENMLMFSKVGGMAFPETQYKLFNEPIRGLLSAPSFLRFQYGTSFIIFTRNSVNRFVVEGTPEDWRSQTDNVIEEYKQYGLLAPRSLVRAGAYLMWLSELGVLRWGSDGLIPVSMRRKEIDLDEDLIGFYNPIRNQYILSE